MDSTHNRGKNGWQPEAKSREVTVSDAFLLLLVCAIYSALTGVNEGYAYARCIEGMLPEPIERRLSFRPTVSYVRGESDV